MSNAKAGFVLMPIRTGDTVGAYEVLDSIGRGGMGEVFRARDPRMGREVAIKVSLDAGRNAAGAALRPHRNATGR